MRRSLVVLAAGLACAGVAILVPYGAAAAGVTVALLLAVGGAALGLTHALARRDGRRAGLRARFSLAVGVVVGQLVAAVIVVVAFMFVSHHDAVLVVVISAFAGAISVRAAQLLATGVLHDVEALRDGLAAVGRGDRDVHMEATSADELAELAGAANAMVARLAAEEAARDASDVARRGLVAAISHDLRTPLTSLRLLADAVGDGIGDEPTRRRYLDTMGTHIRALGALIDDLFELSRLEAGEISWSMEQVRLDELVRETVAAIAEQARAAGVLVVAELPADLRPARANPEKLQRVLLNLIQNAIRHTPADGSVTVRAEHSTAGVVVEIADSGDGIAPADRARVFEPFFRGGADAARTRDGAGLGLAISRAIVEAHGGRIWLEPGGEGGTRVRFSVPADEPRPRSLASA